ncbi:unnamed protein product [Gadus morhua 'NCC']
MTCFVYVPTPGTTALGDDKTVVKPKKQTRGDNKTLSAGRDLSGKLLQDVAKSLGQKWEQAALHLGLKKRDLDEIKKDNKDEYMHRRNMLRLWKDQRPGKATAQDLLRGLEDMKDLPDETRRLLKDASVEIDEDDEEDEGEQSQGRKSSHSGTSLTEDTASMPVVDRCGEEDCSDSGEQSQGRKSIQSGLRSKPVKKKPSHSSGPGSRPGELSSSLPLKKPASDGTLALGDDKTLVKPKKQTRARNNETCSAGQDLSDEQLRDVAQTLGQEWERAALHLGLKKKDLDEIKKEKREFMQRRNMLRLWKDRRPGKVTAQDLLRGLEDMKDLPVETRLLLKDLLPKMESSSSGTSLTEDTASMPVVDRCEEDCSDSGEQSQGRKSSKSDASVEIDEDDEEDEEEMPVKSQREKCKAAQQSPEYVKVTPTEISKQSSNPIIPSSLPVKHHGAVLVYKGLTRECRTDHIFRVFLSLNNDSEIKAVEEQIQIGVKQWIKIEIPPLCLLEEKVYHLTSEPEGQIEPKNQPFTTAVLACKGYFVARFSEHPPFRLFLMDSDSDEPLWSATIREEDWTCEKSSLPKMNQVPNNRGRGEQSQGRKSSQSGEISRIRSKFVQRISQPLIKGLLDDLWQQKVFSTEDKEFVTENQKIKTDMARCLIDMVIGKGETACRIMIDSMKVRDEHFTLDLISSPAAVAEL